MNKRIKRRANPRFAYEVNGRPVPADHGQAVVVDASAAFRMRQEDRLNRRVNRLSGCPERTSVAKAMFAVEQRIVEALWTLARLPNDRGIGFAHKNGVAYLEERADQYANAVANGGWLTVPPKPAPPSGRAIDAMHEPLEWLRFLPRETARILTLGAQYKRGDMARNIGWTRIRERNKELRDYSARYLARRYQEALRMIVCELTIARARQMS